MDEWTPNIFIPEIEESGYNELEIHLKNVRNFSWFSNTPLSTKEVFDEYHFTTSPQVLEWGEEKGGKSFWRGGVRVEHEFPEGSGVNLDSENDDVYGPYTVEFEVGLDPLVKDSINYTGFGVGTAISISGALTVFPEPISTIAGLTVSSIFFIAGIHADNYTTIEATVETDQISVGYGYKPRLQSGVKADYHYREVRAYPDESQDGIADGAPINVTLHYWKNYRHKAILEAVYVLQNITQ